MRIRPETPADCGVISEIQYAAFKGHPQHQPGAEPTEHLIVERLRHAGALWVSLVAEEDGQAVGHVALSPATLDAEPGGWLMLGPVGVLPARQNQGLGSALINEVLRLAREGGAAGVVLVGDPNFYARFGFTSLKGLEYPGVPGPYVLGLAFGPQAPAGSIAAHPAFG